MFRLSGLHRDVYLVAKPKWQLRDLTLTQDFTPALDQATLNVIAAIRNLGKSAAGTVKVTLLDADDKEVGRTTISVPAVPNRMETQVRGKISLDAPKLWSAEIPYLYTVNV